MVLQIQCHSSSIGQQAISQSLLACRKPRNLREPQVALLLVRLALLLELSSRSSLRNASIVCLTGLREGIDSSVCLKVLLFAPHSLFRR